MGGMVAVFLQKMRQQLCPMVSVKTKELKCQKLSMSQLVVSKKGEMKQRGLED